MDGASAFSYRQGGLEHPCLERDLVGRQLGDSVGDDRACEIDGLATRALKQKLCDAHEPPSVTLARLSSAGQAAPTR